MENTDKIGIIPILSYEDLYLNKSQILKFNKGKSGVYRWINKKSGKSYVGSSVNLFFRLRDYLTINYLKREIKLSKRIISMALIKYGYSGFTLEILEYCDVSVLIEREQHYMDLLKPEYNILKIAGSNLGFKHSEVAKTKMKHKYKANLPLRKINHLLATGHITTVVNKKDNSIKLYDSIRAAARDLGTTHSLLSYYMNTNKLYKNIYIITKNRSE